MRLVLSVVALLAATAAVLALAGAGAAAPPSSGSAGGNVAHGRQLYVTGCSSCHGIAARGLRGRGPNLHGVGALAADWYIRTGRMPLAHPTDFPIRAPSVYSPRDQRDLVAYVGSLGGPPIPSVAPARGSLSEGKELFSNFCAGCHQIDGRGGVVTPDTIAPELNRDVAAIDVAEVIRFGPYVMPRWNRATIDQGQTDSLAAYVLSTRHLPNRGGWAIGNLGPIPEGLVAFAIGIVALIAVARLIGTRTEQ